MPTDDKSHAERLIGRGRVTDTHGPYDCGDFRVLRVGGIVALHFGTPAGRIIIHIRERAFVKHARGEHDDQGNKFRTLVEIDRARDALESVEADSPPPAHPAAHMRTTESDEAIFRGIVARNVESGRSFTALCKQYEVPYWKFMNWRSNRRATETDGSKPLILKPGGQLL